jgi:hypothetical protein
MMFRTSSVSALLAIALAICPSVSAFSPLPVVRTFSQKHDACVIVKAGGFEWEDPMGAEFDQGVENPFKNPDLMKGKDDMTIDPARLLAPRLSGVNLYLVGMMGSGKTAVSSIIAKRKLLSVLQAVSLPLPEIEC